MLGPLFPCGPSLKPSWLSGKSDPTLRPYSDESLISAILSAIQWRYLQQRNSVADTIASRSISITLSLVLYHDEPLITQLCTVVETMRSSSLV